MDRITRRRLLVGTAALPTALAWPGGPARAREAGTLVFGLSSYPPNLMPWTSTGTASLTVKLQTFRGLLSFGPDGQVQPELAESFGREGEKGWRFRLRQAVFHNGAPVTAADVKWTLEQIAGEKSIAYLKGQLSEVASIDTRDDRTVVITMKSPTVTLPLILATPFAPIIAKNSGSGPVGAGPYTITDQERGVSVELEAFDKYYKPGLPKSKKLRFIVYADENARVAALQSGDVDMIEYVPWQSMATIEADPKLKLDSKDGPFMALNFNGSTGLFKDARLRQAVAHAIRRDEVVKAAFFGRGSPLESLPIVKSSPFYDDAAAHAWNYDPQKARSLMADAGVGGGFACTLLSTAQYGMHKSTAEVIQQHLGEVGIEVKLDLPDWATRVTLGNRGQYEFCVQGQAADNNDPDGLSAYIDGELPSDFRRSWKLPTPRIHALLNQGRAEFDASKRRAIYAELLKDAATTVPMCGLCWRAQGYGMAKDVSGFANLPGGLNFYSGTSLESTSLM